MKVAIIRYNAGNIRSVSFALERLGVEAIVTDNYDELRTADRVIFPGVGHAESAMEHLKAVGLNTVIPELKQPVLGICLGMQLMCTRSKEGNTDCLGIMNCDVVSMNALAIADGPARCKIPHVGWNEIYDLKTNLFYGIAEDDFAYFIHSYAVLPNEYSIAHSRHGILFAAAMRKDNFFAVQFHPEKSGRTGKKIIENFLNIQL